MILLSFFLYVFNISCSTQQKKLFSVNVEQAIQYRCINDLMNYSKDSSEYNNNQKTLRQIKAVERRIAAAKVVDSSETLADIMACVIAKERKNITYIGSQKFVNDAQLQELARQVEPEIVNILENSRIVRVQNEVAKIRIQMRNKGCPISQNTAFSFVLR